MEYIRKKMYNIAKFYAYIHNWIYQKMCQDIPTYRAKKSAHHLQIKNREIMRPKWKNLPNYDNPCENKRASSKDSSSPLYTCYIGTYYSYISCEKKKSAHHLPIKNCEIMRPKWKSLPTMTICAKKMRIIIYVHMPTQTRGSAWWHFWLRQREYINIRTNNSNTRNPAFCLNKTK